MHLPACFASLILTFAPVFVQQRTWRRAELLLIGAILAPGKRTVTGLLRIVGLGRERRFTSYHRVGVTLKNGRESTVRGAERKRGQAASACFGLAVVPRRGRSPSGPTSSSAPQR